MLLPDLSSDGWLLFASCGVRSFAYGFLSVILGLYLGTLGMSANAIGWIFWGAYCWSSHDNSDHWYRRSLRAPSVADRRRVAHGAVRVTELNADEWAASAGILSVARNA
jgi:hypothetical protein